ncbi:MAG: KDO2-lipid IV(A) lauroyltransferase [Chloroflexi bacterium]|nr:MAG: KDO2-lipid IV(A) lauroyltransferase [Chloroflexota bacterium]
MLATFALSSLDRLARLLPAAWIYALARLAGRVAPPIFERRRQTVRANLQILRPEWSPQRLDKATTRVFQENCAYYADMARLATMTPQQALKRLDVEGLDLLRDAQAAGQGVVVAGAHVGNPEFVVRALSAVGLECAALVEPLSDERRMRAMQARRDAAGVRTIPATISGIKEAVRYVRQGGILAVLADRDIQGGGSCVPFRQRQARFPSGPADIALRTHAALLFCLTPRANGPARGDRFRVQFFATEPLLRSDNPGLDVRANTANLVRLMEPHLTLHADQWRLFESPWKPCRDSAYIDPAGHARPVSKSHA